MIPTDTTSRVTNAAREIPSVTVRDGILTTIGKRIGAVAVEIASKTTDIMTAITMSGIDTGLDITIGTAIPSNNARLLKSPLAKQFRTPW